MQRRECLRIPAWQFKFKLSKGGKEDKVLKEGQVWYVSINYAIILGEVGDEITMEKHQYKRQGEEVETIRVKEGASILRVIH